MNIGPCHQCTKAVYNTDLEDREIEVFYCMLHNEYRTLNFCSEKCFDIHDTDCHQPIDLV